MKRTVSTLVSVIATTLVGLGEPPRALAQGTESTGFIEVGALAGYHSNFFFRGDGSPAPDTKLFSIYSTGEREFRARSGRYTVFFNAGAVRAGDIDNGDHYSVSGGLEFRRGPNKLTGELTISPNLVYVEDGDGLFFDLFGSEFEYRRALGPGLWVQGEYEIEQWSFDPALAERDSTTHKLAGSFRFPISELAGIRTSVEYAVRDANSQRYNYNQTGFALALEAQPTSRVNIFVRYRRRGRDYEDAEAGTNNFMRDDTIHTVVANLRWLIGDSWGIRIEDYYRNGSSTRIDRNYSGNRLLGGAFVVF